jgi:hypothetical protein
MFSQTRLRAGFVSRYNKLMRFKVPQFIDIEDKIFGPLTFKQFMYLAGGAGLIYVSYRLTPLYVALPLIIGIGTLSFSLTFVKINNKPFIYVMEAYIKYILDSKTFIWRKVAKKKEEVAKKKEEAKKKELKSQPLTENKLHELSWGLNIIEE